MRLYDYPLSGNCHKVRLLLALLDLPYEKVNVEIFQGENQTADFLALNPRGQVPVLVDGEEVIWDSAAILMYLARRYGGEQWLPVDALSLARIQQWLALANDEIHHGLAVARKILVLNVPGDLQAAQSKGRAALDTLEGRLTTNFWLAAEHPTIADLACFPYTAMAPLGGLSLEPYIGIQAWVARVKGLAGYVGMPGLE